MTSTDRHPWARYVNPILAGLYDGVGLDKVFVRAEGAYMEDSAGRRYLDFLSGYGSVPLGHHPEALWSVIRSVEQSREPVFSIPALLDGAGRLAQALVSQTNGGRDDQQKCDGQKNSSTNQKPLRYALFANSGSEAVEWAIKLARTCTQRLGSFGTLALFVVSFCSDRQAGQSVRSAVHLELISWQDSWRSLC